MNSSSAKIEEELRKNKIDVSKLEDLNLGNKEIKVIRKLHIGISIDNYFIKNGEKIEKRWRNEQAKRR